MNRPVGVTRVGLVGHGAIGHVLAQLLRDEQVPGCALSAILVRQDGAFSERATDLDDLCRRSDVVVEAAGHAALAELGPRVIAADCDLLVVSTGALADHELHERLLAAGRGRVLISGGAIGGLDTLRAAQMAQGLDSVSLHTTKPSSSVTESWMPAELQEHLRRTADPVTVFSGSARDAAARFPRSVNVAATLALATLGFDRTTVTVTGDPHATHVEHVITARGAMGNYEFRFQNRPSSDNPRTSAITPYAIARALSDRHARFVAGV